MKSGSKKKKLTPYLNRKIIKGHVEKSLAIQIRELFSGA